MLSQSRPGGKIGGEARAQALRFARETAVSMNYHQDDCGPEGFGFGPQRLWSPAIHERISHGYGSSSWWIRWT